MPHRSRTAGSRPGAVLAAVVVTLSLSACQSHSSHDARPSLAPSPTISVAPSALVSTLEFQDPSLPAGANASWKDGLTSDPAWTVVASDGGTGHWKYATKDGECTAQTWQARGIVRIAGNDLAASDEVLAAMSKNDPTGAQGQLVTGSFGYVNAGRNAIASRGLIFYAKDGHATVLMARVFREARLLFSARIDCATLDDFWSEGEDAVTKTAILVH